MSTAVETERLESLEHQVHELEAALHSASKIRIVFFIAVLILMGLIIYLFMGMFHKITSESFQTALLNEAQMRLESDQDRYVNEVRTLVNHASPVVTKAFYEQTKKDMSKYTMVLDQEREVFSQDVQAQLDAKLKDRYGSLVRQYEVRLSDEFPELKDDAFREKVIRSIDKALGNLASKYYTDQLGQSIGGIYEDWDQFPPVDPPRANDPQLGDQLIGTLLELLSHRLAQ